MKKFLSYSLIATLVIVVFGVLVTLGVFDFNMGQVNTTSTSIDPVAIHNEIVEHSQDFAIDINNLYSDYHQLSEASVINEFKENLNKSINTKGKLTHAVSNQYIKDKQKETLDFYYDEYLPLADDVTNTYLKAITYFEEKDLRKMLWTTRRQVSSQHLRPGPLQHRRHLEIPECNRWHGQSRLPRAPVQDPQTILVF